MNRPSTTVAVVLVLCLAAACGGSRRDAVLDPAAPAAALYRARFEPGDGGKTRRFRLLVHAAAPERLHGEVLSAVGTTELVLDSGAEGVSVLFVRDRVAYVGAPDEGALAALLGVPLEPRTLVEVLLGGRPRDSELVWDIVPGPGYPQEIVLADGARRLELTLKRVRPLRADPATLGTGRPPDGIETRPLQALDPESLPGVETEENGG